MVTSESMHAHRHLRGAMMFCSWQAGWRTLLLRAYDDPPQVSELTTSATLDQLIVLVTAGSCAIESYTGGQWRKASYMPGDLGLTAPGEVAKLRWSGLEGHSTLQLHLPAALVEDVASELHGSCVRKIDFPNRLLERDKTVAEVMFALNRAARMGAPELYAETAAHFLATHIMTRHAKLGQRSTRGRHAHVLRRVDDYMRAELATNVTLSMLAQIANLSRFQLAANECWGETPLRRLTRLRMELAQRLLSTTQLQIIEIAFECGYSNPAHFATAFDRHVGTSPSGYRRG
jgi:AraC family transcriptional regulator